VTPALAVSAPLLGGGVSNCKGSRTYTIAFAALILTAGALGDRVGAKRMFMAGFVSLQRPRLACALAPTSVILIVARAAQGVGAAILGPELTRSPGSCLSWREGTRAAVGIWAAGASLALTAGPLVGGALIALVGWRSIFLVNLPIGLTGLWLTWRYATDTARVHP